MPRYTTFFRASMLAAMIVYGQQAFAGCADFLKVSMRALHAKSSVDLCELSDGKPLLIVNTASHCGFTPQFKGLEEIYQEYKGSGLEVIGFSSNDFNQEASSEAKAAKICYVNNGVSFTMLAPTSVRGANANSVFRELTARAGAPDWNFNKYVVSRDGDVVQRFGSSVAPENETLRNAIEAAL